MSGTQMLIITGRLKDDATLIPSAQSTGFRFTVPTENSRGVTTWHNVTMWLRIEARVNYFTDVLKKGAVVTVVGEVVTEKNERGEFYSVKANDVTVHVKAPPSPAPIPHQHFAGEDEGLPPLPGYGAPAPEHGHSGFAHQGYAAPAQAPAGFGHPPHSGYGPAPHAGYAAPTPHPGYAAPAPAPAFATPPAPAAAGATPAAAGVLKF